MRRAARAFSALFALAAIALVAVVLWERYAAPPVVPPPLDLTRAVDRIVVEKAARRLILMRDGTEVARLPIALGFAPQGDKDRQGDGKTPEGLFRINRRNPGSAYHLSLGIDYPRPDDAARARAGGYSPGGDIFIHGQPNGMGALVTIPYDWTAGCIAVSDADIEALWQIAPVGTVVEIRP
jgi:murein L,D-transpeptidase YafK